MASSKTKTVDTVISLAKRRGFVYQCGEIYGGTKSAWDYGPLGVELKDNIKRQWWRSMVQSRDDIVGIDSSVILPTPVWAASGHLAAFVDPLVECKNCHQRFRQDHLQEEYAEKKGLDDPDAVEMSLIACPHCGTKGEWTEPRMFNGLLKTYLGPVESEEGLHYLRPETAQGIFVNFTQVMTSSRKKPPFGIAQIGKSFRNEITPGNFIFRTREFEQMEMEYFVAPGTDEEWHQRWIDDRMAWYTDLGIDADNLRLYEHAAGEALALLQAHRRHRVPLRVRRLGVGRARGHRQPHRLRPHDAQRALRSGPLVLRPGQRRALDALRHRAGSRRQPLDDGLPHRRLHRGRGARTRRAASTSASCCSLDPRLAPAKAAVLPLSRNEQLSPAARDLAAELRGFWNVEFDDAGAIGRRYRRQDEIGTPFCITVDFDTLDDQAVTIRDRDTMQQERIALTQVREWLAARLPGC